MELKLDFGCGKTPKEGFESVDLYVVPPKRPEPHHVVDLFDLPLPWETNSVDEIHCHHLLEFLPNRDTTVCVAVPGVARQDLFFAFMDECWRIIKPGSVMSIKVSNAWCTMAFSDPCMRRRFTAECFAYLQREFRASNGCEHYAVGDWGVDVVPIVMSELTGMHEMAVREHIGHKLNVVFAWVVTLVARK